MYPRTFLITGASKGIGLALSERLSERGHTVVGIARQITGRQFPGKFVSVDLGRDKETKAALADLMHEYTFDGVINNVALVNPKRVEEITFSRLDDVLRVNLHPALHIIQEML